MSLKAFHVVFIAACLALGIGLLAWGVGDYRESAAGSSLGVAIGGVALILAAIPYAVWFVRKLKNVSYL